MYKLKLVIVCCFILFQTINNSVVAKPNSLISINKINNDLFYSDDERIKQIKEFIEKGNTKEALEKLYELLKK